MKIKAEIWEEDGAWCASVPAFPGCQTCADRLEDLENNLKDAIEGWLEAMSSMQPNTRVMEVTL